MSQLHLHAAHLALEVGDALRLRLLHHAHARRGLVHEVDGLVGQLALGDVAVRVRHLVRVGVRVRVRVRGRVRVRVRVSGARASPG